MVARFFHRLFGVQDLSWQDVPADLRQQSDAVFLNLPVGVSYLTPDMKVVRINPYLEQKLGINSSDIEGMYCYDTVGMFKDDKNRRGEDRVCDGCGVKDALKTGDPFKFTRHVSDGFVAEIMGVPVKDGKGAVVGAVEIVLDITERVRMEDRLHEYAVGLEKAVEDKTRELRKSKRFLKNIVESTADAIFTLDQRGRIRFLNTAAPSILGRPRDGLMDVPVSGLLDPSDKQALEDAMRVVDERGVTIHNLKVTTIADDGSKRHHLMSLAKLSEDDEVNRFVVISKDVTREDSLEQEKEDFLAMLTHDLNIPLTSIFGYSSLLLSGEFGEVTGETRASVEGIQVNCQKVIRLASNFLSAGKISKDALVLDVKPESLEPLILDSIKGMHPLIRDKKIVAETQFAPGLPHAAIDREHIERVVSNLVSNAVKHTPPGGRIVLRTYLSDDGALMLDVSDTGAGIPEGELPMLFDKYFQGKYSSRASGTGLGLYIAKNIVKAHGGDISVKSLEGAGTTFTVRLPRTS